MPIDINGDRFDTMGEACARLDLGRQTMLRFIKEGFFTEPSYKKQGKGKAVRYFTASWYEINEKKLKESRDGSTEKKSDESVG